MDTYVGYHLRYHVLTTRLHPCLQAVNRTLRTTL